MNLTPFETFLFGLLAVVNRTVRKLSVSKNQLI